MRAAVGAILIAMIFTIWFLPRQAAGQNPPACANLMTRHGNKITIGLELLSKMFNQRLSAAHSKFTDLHLTVEGGNTLKVSGKNNGTSTSISGPLQAIGSGALKLHANHIVQNGSHEMGLMDFFGKDLADYAHFKKTQSLSAKGNDLFIHPDPLLNVSGRVTSVSLSKSSITLTFAAQPCR